MPTKAYNTYVRLLKELDKLFAKNLGDSSTAERVRDLMDPLWPQLSETEQEELNKNIKLPFWIRVEENLREWKFPNPSETLEIHPYDNDATLREIIEQERNNAGDEAAIVLLGRIISRITGAMG